MKKDFFLLNVLFLLLMWSSVNAQSLTITPEYPQPGELLKIQYDPAESLLEDDGPIQATAYLLEDGLPTAMAVKLEAEEGTYRGSLTPPESTKAIFFTFSGGENSLDNNDQKGYQTQLYDQNAKTVKGGHYSTALVYANFGSIMGLERNREAAMELLKKEFNHYPSSKEDTDYFVMYARMATQLEDEQAMNDVRQYYEQLSERKKKSEEEMMANYALASMLQDNEAAEALANKIKKKYPKGDLAKSQLVNDFREAKDLAAKEQIFDSYQKLAGEEDSGTMDYLLGALARSYGADNWEKFDYYMDMIHSPRTRASIYNSIAWSLSGESLEATGSELEKASELSKKALDLVENAKSNASEKPSYYTDDRWQESMNSTYGMFADTYALLQYKLGNYEEALRYQQAYVDVAGFRDGESNERYLTYLKKAKGEEKAMEVMEEMIAGNKATETIKQDYKSLFIEHHTTEQAAEKYIALLEKEARKELRKEIKKMMIDEPAPTFALKDLDGKEVSLAALKGNVVIIDFWATWCGPCKASFPGMQQAVNKYRGQDVEFLFVNTWENVEDKHLNAAEFIEKNDYTFHVLMDTENEMVENYKVSGIPTKFILDGNGRIRFKSVGFGGNASKLVDELSLMIELAAEATQKGSSMSMNGK